MIRLFAFPQHSFTGSGREREPLMSPRRKISACIHCRQMKLRCDAQERFPAACTRCANSSLRCSIDPSFKRTAKRERVQALEKELQEMKATMMASSPTSAENNSESISRLSQGQYMPDTLPQIPLLPPNAMFQGSYQGIVSQKIDEIEVQPGDIAELLQLYYEHHNPHFPILPNFNTYVNSYSSCPLLFWTLIALAAKHSPKHAHLYSQLKKPISHLAMDVNSAATESFSVIQALLILCWWPLPSGATLTSPTWLYCGLATHRSFQSGLHRPQNYSDFYYQGRLDDQNSVIRQTTWLACFIVNQNTSSSLGLPPTVHVDNTILSVLKNRPNWLAPVLYQHLRIAYQSYQLCQTLGNNESTVTGLAPNPFPIIKMFDTQLHVIQNEFDSSWSPLVEMVFLRAQLQLYSFAYTFQPSGSSETPLDVLKILSNAYLVALRLIQLSRMDPNQVRHWSFVIQHSVEYAVLFLLKISRYPENKFVDMAVTRNAISEAWEMLHGASEVENDHLSRMSAIIEYLSKHNRNSSSKGQSIMVESRMAANLMFDAAWHAKDRFSSYIKESKPLDYTSAAEAEKALQFELDLHLYFNPSFLGGIELSSDFLFQGFEDHGGLESPGR